MQARDSKFLFWMAGPALILAGGTAVILMVAAAPVSAQSTARPTQTMTEKSKGAEVKPAGGAMHPSAAAVHASAVVIDSHADTPQRFLDEHFDLGDALKGGEFNLETARKGNLGAEFFAIWVEPEANKGHYARRTLELIDAVKLQAARHPGEMELVTSVDGIERAHREHKLAALMGI